MRIPLPPFDPDKSLFDGAASSSVVNALPAARGWKPMPSFAEFSDTLPGECKGYTYVRNSAGTYRVIAMTQDAAYALDTTDNSWTDISGTSAPYNGPGEQEAWAMTRFGNYLVIHNYNDPVQVYDIETGADLADLAGSPPQAKYSWVSSDFLVLGHLNQVDGQRTIAWCGVNNLEDWEYSGPNGSDYQVIPEGDEVQAGFGAPGGFIVMQRSAMQFFQFSPSSGFVFTRTVLNPNYGTVSPRSVVPVGPGQFYYLSEDGFFMGADRKAIGAERVDGYLLEDMDVTYLQDVQGAADPFEKMVWWRYRKLDGTYRVLGYDWQLDQWCTSTTDVREMAAIATPAVSIDALDAIYGDLDSIPVSLDSRIFTGGRPTFSAFTSNNKLAYFNGSNLEAVFETAQIEPSAGTRTFCKGSRLITDATTFEVEHGTAPYHGAAITYATASTPNRAYYCPHRGDGRLHKFRVTIPAGTVWSEASALDADFKVTGQS